MCGQALEGIHRSGDIDVFSKTENLPLMTASKALKMTLDSNPKINDLKSMGGNPLEGGH